MIKMTLSKYERNSTVKSAASFKDSDGNLVDPSGNTAIINVLKPDGTYLISGETGARISTGQFEYYFNIGEADPLGIWVITWKAYTPQIIKGGKNFGYLPIVQRDSFQVVEVNESG